jgi:hypothetical protein
MADRLPTVGRTPRPLQIKIGKPEHAMLVTVGRYRYLSAEQFRRLIWGSKVIKRVMKHASGLYHARYLNRVELPSLTRFGSPLNFYCLDQKGYDYLTADGLQPEGRFKASEEAKRGPVFLKHTEQSNDLMILSHCLARVDPRVTVTRMKTERELRLSNLSAIPDGWVEFKAERTAAIAYELDRGTEARRDWYAKVDGYAQAIKGEYQAFFESTYLTIAVITPTQHRFQELLAWTEAHLNQRGDRTVAPFMLFASFDAATADPLMIFHEPIWRSPFSSDHHQLLEPQLFVKRDVEHEP